MAEKAEEWMKSLELKMAELIAETAEKGARDGRDFVKYRILTSGTAKSGKQGRIETGKMVDGVDYRTMGHTNTRARVKFGWLSRPENYFSYQDKGFTHWKSGETVEGMNAIADAREEIKDLIREDLKRRLRGL